MLTLRERNVPSTEIFAFFPNKMRLWRIEKTDRITVDIAPFDREDCVSAWWHGSARHDADRFARTNGPVLVVTRCCLKPDDVQRKRVGSVGVKFAGKPVHGRIVKRRVVHLAG